MTKQTMSITRALAELKRLDERITRESNSAQFIGISVGRGDQKKVYGSQISVPEMEKKIKSSMDSISDLFKRRFAIKGAIVLSNALTKVTVNGVEMTVAEAIELKQSIQLKRDLVIRMQTQTTTSKQGVDKLNLALETKIDTFLTTLYSSDKGTKADANMVETVAKPQRDASEAALIDPISIVDLIEKITEEIAAVNTELDFTLSECNSKTEIVI